MCLGSAPWRRKAGLPALQVWAQPGKGEKIDFTVKTPDSRCLSQVTKANITVKSRIPCTQCDVKGASPLWCRPTPGIPVQP